MYQILEPLVFPTIDFEKQQALIDSYLQAFHSNKIEANFSVELFNDKPIEEVRRASELRNTHEHLWKDNNGE